LVGWVVIYRLLWAVNVYFKISKKEKVAWDNAEVSKQPEHWSKVAAKFLKQKYYLKCVKSLHPNHLMTKGANHE